jgi:PIN domain nuclease of toxin-antitoxin system
VNLLLDTHVVLWWLTDDPTLSAEVKDRLDQEPDMWVSAATIWEVGIKQSLIAQAGCTGLTLASRDPQIHRYDVDLLRV